MSNLNDKATKAASRYLEHRGYTVLETAWKCPAGTCDVIAEDGDAIVFVDVSARRDADKGFPTERCSAGVRERREMVALAWFAEHEEAVGMAVRFDNIAMLIPHLSRTASIFAAISPRWSNDSFLQCGIDTFSAHNASTPETFFIPCGLQG